ncbi:MAG: hypothetical protein R3F11_04455 [Verrucomicrobiales bacterium]
MRTYLHFLLLGIILLSLPVSSVCAKKPEGQTASEKKSGRSESGGGRGGKGGGGPLPAEYREAIHFLAENHEKIAREFKLTDDGYVATTTSADPEVAKILQKHVGQLEKRMKEVGMVRRWDPAFVEFAKHYGEMEHRLEKIDGGVRATVKGKTPAAIKAAQLHGKVVSGFVKHGEVEVQKAHEVDGNSAGRTAKEGE